MSTNEQIIEAGGNPHTDHPTFTPTVSVSALIAALQELQAKHGDLPVLLTIPVDYDKHVAVNLQAAFAGWAIPDLGATEIEDGREQNRENAESGEPEPIWPDDEMGIILLGRQVHPVDKHNLINNWSNR